MLESIRRYREKVGPEILRERVRRSKAKEDPVERRRRHREQNLHSRIQALVFLGGKCEHCGNRDMRVLQIDHINGNGTRENLRIHARGVVRRVLEYPTEYQVLCANCNWIKRDERNETKPRID